jgi:hypothetical protein
VRPRHSPTLERANVPLTLFATRITGHAVSRGELVRAALEQENLIRVGNRYKVNSWIKSSLFILLSSSFQCPLNSSSSSAPLSAFLSQTLIAPHVPSLTLRASTSRGKVTEQLGTLVGGWLVWLARAYSLMCVLAHVCTRSCVYSLVWVATWISIFRKSGFLSRGIGNEILRSVVRSSASARGQIELPACLRLQRRHWPHVGHCVWCSAGARGGDWTLCCTTRLSARPSYRRLQGGSL